MVKFCRDSMVCKTDRIYRHQSCVRHITMARWALLQLLLRYEMQNLAVYSTGKKRRRKGRKWRVCWMLVKRRLLFATIWAFNFRFIFWLFCSRFHPLFVWVWVCFASNCFHCLQKRHWLREIKRNDSSSSNIQREIVMTRVEQYLANFKADLRHISHISILLSRGALEEMKNIFWRTTLLQSAWSIRRRRAVRHWVCDCSVHFNSNSNWNWNHSFNYLIGLNAAAPTNSHWFEDVCVCVWDAWLRSMQCLDSSQLAQCMYSHCILYTSHRHEMKRSQIPSNDPMAINPIRSVFQEIDVSVKKIAKSIAILSSNSVGWRGKYEIIFQPIPLYCKLDFGIHKLLHFSEVEVAQM